MNDRDIQRTHSNLYEWTVKMAMLPIAVRFSNFNFQPETVHPIRHPNEITSSIQERLAFDSFRHWFESFLPPDSCVWSVWCRALDSLDNLGHCVFCWDILLMNFPFSRWWHTHTTNPTLSVLNFWALNVRRLTEFLRIISSSVWFVSSNRVKHKCYYRLSFHTANAPTRICFHSFAWGISINFSSLFGLIANYTREIVFEPCNWITIYIAGENHLDS